MKVLQYYTVHNNKQPQSLSTSKHYVSNQVPIKFQLVMAQTDGP